MTARLPSIEESEMPPAPLQRPKRRTMDTIRIVGAVIAVLMAGAGVAITVVARRMVTAGHATAAPPPAGSSAPSAAAAEPATPDDYVGVLLPPLTVNVASRVDGKLDKLDAELGRVVRAGEPLGELDKRLQKHSVEIARANLQAARAATAAAGVEVDRSRDHSERRHDTTVVVGNETLSLVSGEEIAQAKFDQHSASAKLLSSNANAVQALRSLEQMATLLGEHELRAPFDCVIAARYLDPGSYVKAGDPILRIVATGEMIARFAVPEDQIGSIKLGAPVRVRLDSSVLDARVERISPEVEPASRTVFVEARTAGAGSACREGCAGMAGRVVRVVPNPN